MIDALIAGRLHGAPAERTTSAGKPFATCKVRVSLRDGVVLFINVIAFDRAAVTALLALSDGDSVALAGELTPKVWVAPDGAARPKVDLLAHGVLSEYHVARKRKTVRAADPDHPGLPFDDALPGAA